MTHSGKGKGASGQGTSRTRRPSLLVDLETLEAAAGGSLAVLLHSTERSIARWRAGEPCSPDRRQLLRLLARASRWLDLAVLDAGRDALRLSVVAGIEDNMREEIRAELEVDDEDPVPDPPAPVQELRAPAVVVAPAECKEAAPSTGENYPPAAAPAEAPTLVRIRHRDGRVEECSAAHAARLGDVVEMEGEWTEEQREAVLAAHQERKGREVATLQRDGLLAPFWSAR